MRVSGFLRSAVVAAAVVLCASPAHADLIVLGGGMVYDSDQDLTWMQDPWFARSSGVDADGLMTYDSARSWANNLVYAGHDDWRLPRLESTGIWQNSASEISSLVRSAGWYWDGRTLNSRSPTPFTNLNLGPFWVDPGGASCGGCFWWTSLLDIDLADGPRTASPWLVREGRAAVPEPSTLLLIGLGAVGAAIRARRKNAQA